MADGKKSSIGGRNTCHLLNVKKPERTAKRLKFSFLRTHAVLTVHGGKQIEASLTLIDIAKNSAGLFTEKLLGKGSVVDLAVDEPKPLKVKGIVAWSIPVSSGIMTRKFPYRSGIQFQYENEDQRIAVLGFISHIEAQLESGNVVLISAKAVDSQPKQPVHPSSEDPPLAPGVAAPATSNPAESSATAPSASSTAPPAASAAEAPQDASKDVPKDEASTAAAGEEKKAA